MRQKIQAIVFERENCVSIKSFELATCEADELVCQTLYTYVSPGTELRVLEGHYVPKDRYPLIPDYAVVAKIVKTGSKVKGFHEGDLITGRNPKLVPGINSEWGGQASYHVYKITGEDRPVLLPRNANPLDYVICEVAAISLRGIEAADPREGETAIVIGQGLIGAFSAAWLQLRGCRVLVADINQERLERARDRGVGEAVNMTENDAMERIQAFCNGGADIVVESSGTIPGINTAYKLVRRKPQNYSKEYKVEPITFYHSDWPRLVVQANYIEKISIDPFSFFSGEGLTVLTPADRGIEERQKVVEAIRRKDIEPRDFIDAVLPFTEAEKGYEGLKTKQFFSVVYDWTKSTT